MNPDQASMVLLAVVMAARFIQWIRQTLKEGREAVEAYESAEYQELSKIRKAATENGTFTIMEGMDEATKLRRAMGK